MSRPETYLIIEIGEPFATGEILQLRTGETLLGRSWNSHRPDLSFTSLLVSRSHAVLSFNDNQAFITDLSSKHGTTVNDLDIKGHKAFALKHGDRINLAKSTVILTYNNENEDTAGETVNFAGISAIDSRENRTGLVINTARREVLLDGVPVNLFGKDAELLMLLWVNQCEAVSYREIKATVWPERASSATGGVPDVGADEISALVYRLRKRLGKYGKNVISIPRFGYLLDLDQN